MTPNNQKPNHQNAGGGQKNNNKNSKSNKANRGAASRATRRNIDMANKVIGNYDLASHDPINQNNGEQPRRANVVDDGAETVKIIPLGGQDAIGAKNMFVIECGNDALIIDVGFDLSVDLPGINFMIPETTYLDQIKHKIKGYVFTHGHLDHIGGVPYILPKYPAPIYGSRFTVGMIEKTLEGSDAPGLDDYRLNATILNEDNHDKIKVGQFTVELVRVTHSIPGSTLVIVDTPAGKIVHTGDYRLDPEPLDHHPTDMARIEQLGQEGVTLLLGESTNAQKPGRTETEHTLIESFETLFKQASGRVFVATFSSNMNRVQMLVDAAVKSGRKIAFDGRSMLNVVELAIRLGVVRIPKGQIIPMQQAATMNDDDVAIVLTGSQGEENAALKRMSTGDHKHIKLKSGDSVILSSTPIPGNEVAYEALSDSLSLLGVHLYRARTHAVDGCGPLHVSGHANREEMQDMIKMTKPKFFVPIYAGKTHQNYHRDAAKEIGFPEDNIKFLNNGDVMILKKDKAEIKGKVPAGAVLVDDSGSVVSSVVVKDRLLMSENGIVSTILTINGKTGQLMSSPDIITRGFIYIRDNEELMSGLRTELRDFTNKRFRKSQLDKFKQDLRDHVQHILFEETGRSPMIIPVVNVIDPNQAHKKPQKITADINHQ